MSANFLNTNRNTSRYFFATSEDGEQTLGLQFGTTGGVPNLSTMAVTISGSGGNGVIVTEAPQFNATEFVLGEEAVLGGGAGYFSPSTLTSNYTGFSLSSDRVAGSGITSIESYRGNGITGGFEYLVHGVGGALLSTTNVGINSYISSIGRTGATAVLGATGNFVTASETASLFQSSDEATTGGGRACFLINDLSGAAVSPLPRWGMGTRDVPIGLDSGSDFTIYRYGDAGSFLGTGYSVRRSDGAFEMPNCSSVFTTISTGVSAQVFPASKTNVEFGADSNVVVVAGASNQAFAFMPLLSTSLTGLNPNGQTFLSINWANALSTGSNHVNFKVGFSTSTAYTNLIQTVYVPGTGGSWTPSDQPGLATPVGHTLITGCIDPDGVNPDGSGVLYVLGQLSDPTAAADQLFLAKGQLSEPTRNALIWRPI